MSLRLQSYIILTKQPNQITLFNLYDNKIIKKQAIYRYLWKSFSIFAPDNNYKQYEDQKYHSIYCSLDNCFGHLEFFPICLRILILL